jgi:2-methylcitrate dehydratase PrpD
MAGTAAQSGALAAFAARQGFLGDLDLLGERWGKLFGIVLESERLAAPAGNEPHAAQLAMKAWCGARQAMAALAGFTSLLREHGLNATDLREILVEVPGAYLQMIDRPGLPRSRQESFANLRYLFGLAAFAPDGLYDVARDNLRVDSRFEALAQRIRIAPSEELARHFPRHWPAKVSVTDQQGRPYAIEILHAPGDPETPLRWDSLVEKFHRVTGSPQSAIALLAAACRDLSSPTGLKTLLALVDREMQSAAEKAAG